MAAKKIASVDRALCVACGACVKICPRSAISVLHGKYAAVDPVKCIGCGICARECPASVILMEEARA